MSQMGPSAILDLREIRLAETTADFALHCSGQFLLGHRTAQSAERAFDGAEGAEFVAKFHGVLAYCNLQISYYISLFCQAKSNSRFTFPTLFILNGLRSCRRKYAEPQSRCAAERVHSGFRSDCRSIPSCWHFLYRWLRSRPNALATFVM